MSTFRVHVYTLPRDVWRGKARPALVLAYIRWQGIGACMHEIAATDGARAKLDAIKQHRATCLNPTQPG